MRRVAYKRLKGKVLTWGATATLGSTLGSGVGRDSAPRQSRPLRLLCATRSHNRKPDGEPTGIRERSERKGRTTSERSERVNFVDC